MHFYDIHTGRKAPSAHEVELGVLGSTLFDTLPLMQIYCKPGIELVDGGHLVTCSLVRSMKEEDQIFKLNGASRPLILRRRPECQSYEFLGYCRGYSWSASQGEEWDNIRKSEQSLYRDELNIENRWNTAQTRRQAHSSTSSQPYDDFVSSRIPGKWAGYGAGIRVMAGLFPNEDHK
jgi:hypothetical protein